MENVDEMVSQRYTEIISVYNRQIKPYKDCTIQEVIESETLNLSMKSIFCLYKLVENIPNGEIRPQQIVMIDELAYQIEGNDNGLVQAGTGVGKSIAYLIPAIISGRKCFVSTSTKQLTSQLTEKDLPLLQKYLFPDLEFIGLQSLSNYICPKKLFALRDEASKNEGEFAMTRGADELKSVKKALTQFKTYADGKIRTEDFTIDSMGCNCESFQCSGSGCVRGCKYEGKELCPVFRIVSKVRRSNVVVTNHAFVSNMLVRASKETDKDLGILKGRTLWLCDEAHDLENYLEKAFSTELSYDKLDINYLQKLQKYAESDAPEATFKNQYEMYRSSMEESKIDDEFVYKDSSEVKRDFISVYRIVYTIREMLGRHKTDAEFYLDDLNRDKKNYQVNSLEREVMFTDRDIKDIKSTIESLQEIKPRLETLNCIEVRYAATVRNIVNDILESAKILYLADAEKDGYVIYFNLLRNGDNSFFTLSATYLKTGDALQAGLGYLDLDKSSFALVNKNKVNMIGVSATLCIGGRFFDMADKLGMNKLKDIHCYCKDVGTVFDYKKQGLMYMPKGMPDVKNHRKEQFAYFKENVVKLIDASKGGALVLCTTNEETKQIAEYLDTIYKGKYKVFSSTLDAWKNKNKNDMVKEFREDVDSILVGTRGFFQGLDVQGESLRLLCLNKLPFAGESVLSKRKMKIAEEKGQQAYRTVSLVPTTMLLLQAIGRLIRHTSDKGVVAIFDDRLFSGQRWISPLVESLPPFTVVDDVKDIEDFFK